MQSVFSLNLNLITPEKLLLNVNYLVNKTCKTLLEKQRGTLKWCSSMDHYTWSCLCWPTSKNLFTSGWLVGWVLWHINLYKLFYAKSIFMHIVLFQTIQFSISTQFNYQKHFYFKLFNLVLVHILFTQLNAKTVLY